MAKPHVVAQGECLSSIAKAYGFANWKVLHDLPENASLKARRPNPNALMPGDRVAIPDRVPKSKQGPLGQWYEFRVERALTTLRLQLTDLRGKALASCAYTLDVQGEQRTGTTDGKGILNEQVDASADSAVLTVKPGDPDLPEVLQWQLQLGALDPSDAVSGAQGRLTNLGLYHGPIDGLLSEDTRFSLRTFQRVNSLDETGRLDDQTVAALEDQHDGVT